MGCADLVELLLHLDQIESLQACDRGNANVICKRVLKRSRGAAGQAHLVGPVIVRLYPRCQFLVRKPGCSRSVCLQFPDNSRIELLQ